jgi:hypothetical protein
LTWADDAENLPAKACSIAEWKQGAWKEGVKSASSVQADVDASKENHAVLVDVSEKGGNAIEPGKETLFVNAAIMDVSYRPVNAPWVVDIDLPKKEGSLLS